MCLNITLEILHFKFVYNLKYDEEEWIEWNFLSSSISCNCFAHILNFGIIVKLLTFIFIFWVKDETIELHENAYIQNETFENFVNGVKWKNV